MKNVRLMYASKVADNFDPAELDKILATAIAHNEQADITGLLFFTTDYFIQCLEGSRSAVNALYNDLVNDPRHTNLVILSYKETEDRMFSSWRMAYIAPGEISEEMLNKHSESGTFSPDNLDESMANALLLLLEKHITD